MDLIDRDELELDTEWSDYYDGFTSYSQSQINGAVEVQAVPLDKVKQAIEEIEQTLYVDSLIFGELIDFKDGKISADDVIEEFNRVTRKEVFSILDKLIEESEDK